MRSADDGDFEAAQLKMARRHSWAEGRWMLYGHLFRFSLCGAALLLGLVFFGGAAFVSTGTQPPSIPASNLDPLTETIGRSQQQVSESPPQQQSQAESLQTASLPEELVASGAVAGKPCKVSESEPAREDFAPVFVEEQLLNRTASISISRHPCARALLLLLLEGFWGVAGHRRQLPDCNRLRLFLVLSIVGLLSGLS